VSVKKELRSILSYKTSLRRHCSTYKKCYLNYRSVLTLTNTLKQSAILNLIAHHLKLLFKFANLWLND